MTSFWNGTVPSGPLAASSWWVKLNCRSESGTPRSDWKLNALTLAPMSIRPRPMVWARSAKIGPAEVSVRTGNPDADVPQTAPLDAALIGMFDALVPIASDTKLIRFAWPNEVPSKVRQ